MGNATTKDLARTYILLFIIELTSILPTFGILNGGSSSEKDEVVPFKTVFDKSFEAIIDIITENTIKKLR